MTRPVEIALVGCGAIAQRGYLPAMADVPEVRCGWVIDLHKELAESTARRFKVPSATNEYSATLELVEAVILAVPNYLHAPMALEALNRRKPVLCEKPLGRTAQEVRNMVTASQNAGVPLVTGMIMRHYPGLRRVQEDFPWSALGKVQGIKASYGVPLDWPLSNIVFFEQQMAGGGVWLDFGVHVLDALFWIFTLDEVVVTDYLDDAEGGVESEARACLTVILPDGEQVPCKIEVSRLRALANRIEVAGEHGSLVIPLSADRSPWVSDTGGRRSSLTDSPDFQTDNCFAEQLRAFARRIHGVESACADGRSQIRVLEVVESCYRARRRLSFVWDTYEPWFER